MSNRNDKIWVFNSGNTFSGNPKYIYIYINKYRKDIKTYWLCDDNETIKQIRSLGYKAYNFKSKKAWKIEEKAGVFVVEAVKEYIPIQLEGVKILNLWHGVGCKSIERKVNAGFLNERIAKKYIKYNKYYKNNQLFLVTSPLMEKHFKEQCGIDDDKIIRAGYPRCIYNLYKKPISTYNHNIRKQKGLNNDTKIAIYAPTYRETNKNNFFNIAIPDIERLIEKLKQLNMLLIFKVHYFMEKDSGYNKLKEYYKDCPNLIFWDNNLDIYEIFNEIDLAIIDYSSIFYDMLSAGIPHFLRYIFDYEDKNNVREAALDYKEMTCGKICNNFDELLNALDNYQEDDKKETEKINNLFWSYSNPNSFEDIIQKTLDFKIEDRNLPNLYSFDIFDTLISRKVLLPEGIFYYVKDKMKQSNLNFPTYVIDNFVSIRKNCEKQVREFYKKSIQLRNSERLEITFDEIYEQMANVYGIEQELIDKLKEWELEAEYENIIPRSDNIQKVCDLLENNEKVVLISDMYLPKEFVAKLLEKVEPRLASIPIYLSSELGVQKTTKKLYLKVYENMDYIFDKWYHYGDNKNADGKKAKELGIEPEIHKIENFNKYEKKIISTLKSYDSYLVAASFARFRKEHQDVKEYYSYAYVSLYWVPYISWVLKDAIKRNIKCLYFISRDGHFLKQIADNLIKIKKYDIKTKYIYGSRKAWRIPSYVNEIDEEFFGNFGNFSDISNIKTFDNLLDVLHLNKEKFIEIFHEYSNLAQNQIIEESDVECIKTLAQHSDEYHKYILDVAKSEREIVNKYLKQEINFNEKYAFVEYWGRGYTQDCLVRLIHDTSGKQDEVPMYYVRSIYPTIGKSVRYNFTTNSTSLIFVEAIFANMPYKSIVNYKYQNEKIEPDIIHREYDEELYNALTEYLELFCKEIYSNNFLDEDKLERELFDFSLSWYSKNQNDKYIYKTIAHLKYSGAMYSDEQEYAPTLRFKAVLKNRKDLNKLKKQTSSIDMSLARASKKTKRLYKYLSKNK